MEHMQNAKTLRLDSLLVEFYKYSWDNIKGCLMDLIAQVEKGKDWHSYFLHGVINLIINMSDNSRIEEYIPFNLLNVVYKI